VFSDGGWTQGHRWVWEQCHGPILDGLCVCHVCDNPKCVRPSHLFLGTDADNALDKVTKARQSTEGTHGRARLTVESVRRARVAFAAGGVHATTLARRLGVSQRTVMDALEGITWKSAGGPLKALSCDPTKRARGTNAAVRRRAHAEANTR
jgi:hypothetical protein